MSGAPQVLRLDAIDAIVAAPTVLYVVGGDGRVRRLDLADAGVQRIDLEPAGAGLIAARGSRLVLGDAVRSTVVDLDSGNETELPIQGLRAAAFVGRRAVITLGSRTVSRFELGGDGVERRWTQLFTGLGRQLVRNAAGDHVAVAQRHAVSILGSATGEGIDSIPIAGGASGFAVDPRWRHWVVWRDGDCAIHRAGRDDRVGRWRFERVATGTLQPVAAAVDSNGCAWVVDASGRLAVQSRSAPVEDVVELGLDAPPRRLALVEQGVLVVGHRRLALVRLPAGSARTPDNG